MEKTPLTKITPQGRASLLPAAGGMAGLVALFITLLHHGPPRLSAQVARGPDGRPAPVATAAAPWLLPFQGRLTTSNGKPLTEGEATVVFSLYDAPTGGPAAWSSGPLKLKVGPGGLVHSVLGGEANPLEDKVDFSRDVYLGIKVDDPSNTTPATNEPEMLPRIRILPALHAKNADALGGRGHDEILGGLVPVGTILAYAGRTPPREYRFCDGAELAISSHETLYAAIGNSWGPASAGMFRLPDLRGEFLRGADDMLSDRGPRGIDGSRKVGDWQDHALERHIPYAAMSETSSNC